MSDQQQRTTIGRYRIDAVLGQGAMGVVYRGYDVALNRPVAIKTVHADLLGADRADWLARFRQEAHAVGRCQHPNIVAVYDYGEYQDTPYLALEFVDGRELKALLNEAGRLGQRQAVWLTVQVLDALECAHRSGVIHRDIKPANIMVTAENSVKVADFGVARLDTSDLTQAGTMLGTPSYMSPEQFKGDVVTAAADIYACGVLLYQLLAGRPPFTGKSSSEVMYRILTEMPEFRGDGWSLAPAFRGVINRALAKQPGDRFASAAEFAEVLRRLYVCLDDDPPASAAA